MLPGSATPTCMSDRYLRVGDDQEVELPRGDVTEGVVRVGDTVRRPHQDTSDAVAAYLGHLESVGFDRAPRHLGRDEKGRDVLTYLEGDVPGDYDIPQWAARDQALPGVAQLVRALHDASEGFRPGRPMRPSRADRPTPSMPDEPPELVMRRWAVASAVTTITGR